MNKTDDVEEPRRNIGERLSDFGKMFTTAKFRDTVFVIGLLAIEALLAYRYGYDTYMLALQEGASVQIALTDAAMIDGVFVLLVTIAHFAGRGKKASKLRPLTLAGAAYMYFVVMLPIASTQGQVARAARIAGAMMLLYVGSDMLIDLYHLVTGWARKRKRGVKQPFTERLRAANSNVAYVVGMIIWLLPSWVVLGFFTVARDYLRDLGLVVLPARQTKTSTIPAQSTKSTTTNKLQAFIERNAQGRYEWTCPACNQSSTEQTRGKSDYASESSAKRGFAGHASKHANMVVVDGEIVEQ